MLKRDSQIKALSGVRHAETGVEKALAAINEGEVGVRASAKLFEVTLSTVQRAQTSAAKGRPIGRPGAMPLLNDLQNAKLVQECLRQASLFTPYTKMEIRLRVC